jgi:stage V sporulation protein G
MPSRRKKNGEFKDVAHPLNNETRRMIEGKVLAEYERALSGRAGTPAEAETEVAPAPPAAAVPESAPVAEPSLEEVEEAHLRDSFWSAS